MPCCTGVWRNGQFFWQSRLVIAIGKKCVTLVPVVRAKAKRFGFAQFRFAAAAILLTAAFLKAYQLATTPSLGEGLLHARWFNILVVEFELFFGIWLIVGLLPKLTWPATIGCFSVFAAVSLYKAFLGEASCGCWGAVDVNPWLTATFDVVIVGLLLIFRESTTAPPVDKKKVLTVMVVWLVLAVPVSFAMLSLTQWAHELGTELKGFDGRRMISLEPEKWIGKEFPLIPYFAEPHEGDLLKQGGWNVLLIHIDCERCQQMMADLKRQNAEQVALAVILSRSSEEVPKLPFPAFVLDNQIDWHAITPRMIKLSEGICDVVE